MSLINCQGCGETHDQDRTCAKLGLASEDVIRMVFAFGDKERKDDVKRLAERVRKLEWFVIECRDDFDCDHDAHRYNTTCRACAAAKLVPKE